jgi:general L-amino acid transport system ATP-binding protein
MWKPALGRTLVRLVISFTASSSRLLLVVPRSTPPGCRSSGRLDRFHRVLARVPLITVLFFATYMPFFFPGLRKIDGLRVLIGVVLCRSYMAEVVRGAAGDAARPYERPWCSGWPLAHHGFAILPQALRLVFGIVNSFIALFKDTTLCSRRDFDLLNNCAAFADPAWATPVTLFTGFVRRMIYFLVSLKCRATVIMERRLNTGRRGETGLSVSDESRQRRVGSIRHRPRHAHDRERNRDRDHRPDKWFGSFHVLKVDLVMRGERVVICGPSGSGKSTLFRCINRIEDWQRGRVIVDGMELTEDLKKIDEVRREVGMVFQQFNLFPHLTVLDNCTLAPIWVRKLPKKEADEVARQFLERVRIPEQADKYPAQPPADSSSGSRTRALYAAENHANRRADLGARSGDGQGGARHHGRPRARWHDHGGGQPRWDLRASREPHGVDGCRPDHRNERARGLFNHPRHERTKLFLSQILHRGDRRSRICK